MFSEYPRFLSAKLVVGPVARSLGWRGWTRGGQLYWGTFFYGGFRFVATVLLSGKFLHRAAFEKLLSAYVVYNRPGLSPRAPLQLQEAWFVTLLLLRGWMGQVPSLVDPDDLGVIKVRVAEDPRLSQGQNWLQLRSHRRNIAWLNAHAVFAPPLFLLSLHLSWQCFGLGCEKWLHHQIRRVNPWIILALP